MSRKIFIIASLVFVVLSLLSSGSANAQVRVIKSGRPWEIDAMAIPYGEDQTPSFGAPVVFGAIRNPSHEFGVRRGSTNGDPVPQASKDPGSGESSVTDLLIRAVRRLVLHLTF
jgi:hypothetical protein